MKPIMWAALTAAALFATGCVMPADLARLEQSQAAYDVKRDAAFAELTKKIEAAQERADEQRTAAIAQLREETTDALDKLEDGTISREEADARLAAADAENARRIEAIESEQDAALAAAEERYEDREETAAEKFNADLDSAVAAAEQRTAALISAIQGTVGAVETTVNGMKSGQIGHVEGGLGLLGTAIGTYLTVQGVRNRKYTKAGLLMAGAQQQGSHVTGWPPQVVTPHPPNQPTTEG